MAVAAIAAVAVSCSNDEYSDMTYPNIVDINDYPVVEDIHTCKAPLYWSIYEYCYDIASTPPYDVPKFSAQQWGEVCDWMAEKFKPYGYDMICTDGFCEVYAKDGSPYMTHYDEVAIKDLVEMAAARGLKVGIYDNPMWLHCDPETLIPGTDIKVGTLLYDRNKDEVNHPSAYDKYGYKWLLATHEGAKEWIDGYFKYFKELGVEYIRIDFLSWMEDGNDRLNGQKCSKGYGRENYALCLSYIAQSAKKYGIFTSLVMPHLYNDAEIERRYGNMVRIVRDTYDGGWAHTSETARGQAADSWPNCENQFDGFTFWSKISGREQVILDGDFIRLHSYANDQEKQSVISLQLMAGGPVTITDQPSSLVDGDEKFYTNTEMLALNADRFVGKPLDDALNSEGSNIWYGQMSNGDYVVGLFNRDDTDKAYNIELSQLGISGPMKSRDLWLHADEGEITSLDVSIPPHGCKIVRLSK